MGLRDEGPHRHDLFALSNLYRLRYRLCPSLPVATPRFGVRLECPNRSLATPQGRKWVCCRTFERLESKLPPRNEVENGDWMLKTGHSLPVQRFPNSLWRNEMTRRTKVPEARFRAVPKIRPTPYSA